MAIDVFARQPATERSAKATRGHPRHSASVHLHRLVCRSSATSFHPVAGHRCPLALPFVHQIGRTGSNDDEPPRDDRSDERDDDPRPRSCGRARCRCPCDRLRGRRCGEQPRSTDRRELSPDRRLGWFGQSLDGCSRLRNRRDGPPDDSGSRPPGRPLRRTPCRGERISRWGGLSEIDFPRIEQSTTRHPQGAIRGRLCANAWRASEFASQWYL